MANRTAHQTGTTYLVQDGFWYSLPDDLRRAVYWGFHQAFTLKVGAKPYMKLEGVDHTRVPQQIDFVDAVVRVTKDVIVAQRCQKRAVSSQIRQVQQYFRQPPPSWLDTSIEVGRAFCLKAKLKDQIRNDIKPICVTDAVISFYEALGIWQINLRKLREQKKLSNEIREDWLKKAPVGERKWFGVCLGRLVAHEAWHQIWSQDKAINPGNLKEWGKRHPETREKRGIEEDEGGKYWQEKVLIPAFGDHGRAWIVRTLPKLAELQGKQSTVAISRCLN